MIRPLTCICMLLAGGSGLYLYQSKHQAQMLDREIGRTLKATDAARERIGVLRGEWALLNEPDRLAALSQTHLGLKTLTPGQFVTAAELGARLPPPAMPGAAPASAEESADAPGDAALPEPPPAPAMVPPAPAVPAPPRPVVAVAKPAPAAPLPRPPMQAASALPLPAAPLPAPKPGPARPVLASVVNVSASPIPAPRPAPARAAQAASPAPGARPALPAPDAPAGDSALRVAQHVPGPGATAPAAPGYGQPPAGMVSASVLGGARPLLPPPVPYGSAPAASGASAR